MNNIFTVGFTKKSAERFFGLLKSSSVRRILDTRLNNTGQLAGFSKRDDLEYFAREIVGASYVHWIEAAPTEEMLRAYKTRAIKWDDYERQYLSLIQSRELEKHPLVQSIDRACLLCSEDKPHHCHRRLLAAYLAEKLPGGATVVHL